MDAMLAASGHYEVMSLLGEGGQGKVYLVREPATGRRLALKAMRLEPDHAEAARLRFKQEFRAMGRLVHPNLCAVHDYGVLPDGTPFFTMELVEGQSLEDLIPLSPDALMPLLAQIGQALGYLHSQGYVHCDIKPENIRLTSDGTVKLMDFGLLAPAGQSPEAIQGTLAYISPEAAKRDRVDARADLYSLGAMVYHLLAGQLPIRGATPLELLRNHLNEAPRPLSTVCPDVPPAIEAGIVKMLAKEPSARPRSVADALLGMGIATEDLHTETLLAPPFVGRQSELARLNAALASVKESYSGALWQLTGAAGMGKSRLLGEFRFQAQLSELPVFTATCHADQAPYAPFISLLRAVLPTAKTFCPEELEAQGPILSRLLPELTAGRPPSQVEPDQERILIQSALTRVLVKAIAPTGGVVVLEGWELADPLSVQTLGYLLRNACEVLGTAASKPSPENGAWAGVPLVMVVSSREALDLPGGALPLGGLTRGEVDTMVEGVLGQKGLPASLVEQIRTLSEGNPRLVSAMLEHALAAGALERQGDAWRLPEIFQADDLATDVRRVLNERIAGLDADGVRVAGAASVLGDEVRLDRLAAVLGMPEDGLFDAVAELVQARVLDVAPGGYRFTSSELRELVYGGVDAASRLALHRAAAELLEASFGTDGTPELDLLDDTARHWLATGDAGRAVPLALQAAIRNKDLNAHLAAATLLEAGLALLPSLEPGSARDTLRADYLLHLAQAEQMVHRMEHVMARLTEATALAEALDDKRRLAHLLATQAVALNSIGGPGSAARSVKLNEQAIPIAREAGDLAVVARASVNRGRIIALGLGEIEQGRIALGEALACAREAKLPLYEGRALSALGYAQVGHGPTREEGFANLSRGIAILEGIGDKYGEGYTLMMLSDAYFQAGRYREAAETASRNAAIMHELSIPDDRLFSLINRAMADIELGRIGTAIAELRGVRETAEERQSLISLEVAKGLLGHCLARRGEAAEAEPLLTAAAGACLAHGTNIIASVLPWLVDGWLALGRFATARATLQEAVFTLRSYPDPYAQRMLSLCQAEIRSFEGNLKEAEELAEGVRSAAIEADARGQLARALVLKAELAYTQGRVEEASALAEQGQAVAGPLGAAIVLARLAGLRGAIAHANAQPDAVSHFQAMHALADQLDAPLLRAEALAGQSLAVPAGAGAGALLVESQRVLRSLGDAMDEAGRAELLAFPPAAQILARNAAIQGKPVNVSEGNRDFTSCFQRVSADLHGLFEQYGSLYQEWQDNNQQLQQLNALASKVNETLDLTEVLRQVVLLTLEITQAERGFVLMRGNGRYEDLVCHSAYNQLGQAISNATYSFSICQKVLATNQAVALLDASADLEFQAAKSITALNIQTVMCVPLRAKGKVIGLLYVDSQAVVTTFTEKDLELLRAVAVHAGVAIDNAMLYERASRHAAELEEALSKYRAAEREANTDVLTALPNRRHFVDQANRELSISRRYDRPLSVIIMDVDHFKKFNDTYGHAIGDEVLKAVARVLEDCVPEGDLAARLGGEEFTVMCPNKDPEEAAVVAERIRAAIADVRLTDADGQPVRQITCSLGVALLIETDQNVGDVLERADVALYACKAGGRNQVQIWRPEMVPAP